MLGELAEWLHAAAHKTQRMLMESEEVDEVVRLNGSLVKLARGVRQCVFMHARLETGRLKAQALSDAERAEAEREAHEGAVDRLKSRVERAVSRRFEQAWPETGDLDDNDAFNERLEDLGARLDDLSEGEAFLALDPDALIAQLCEEFAVEPPENLTRGAGEGDHEVVEGALPPQRAERVAQEASRAQSVNGHAPEHLLVRSSPRRRGPKPTLRHPWPSHGSPPSRG
jgi:hypothetical protein